MRPCRSMNSIAYVHGSVNGVVRSGYWRARPSCTRWTAGRSAVLRPVQSGGRSRVPPAGVGSGPGKQGSQGGRVDGHAACPSRRRRESRGLMPRTEVLLSQSRLALAWVAF